MEYQKFSTNNLIYFDNQVPLKFWSKPINDEFKLMKNPIQHGELFKFQKKTKTFRRIELRLFKNCLLYFNDQQLTGCRKLSFEILRKSKNTDFPQYPYGFSLIIGTKEKKFYTDSEIVMNIWYQELKKFTLLLDVANEYDIVSKIGNGNSSKVLKIRKKTTGDFFAAKVIPIESLSQSTTRMANFKSEIEALRTLKHQAIVKLEAIYLGTQRIYIVTELLEGGTIFERIRNKKKFSEETSAKIMKTLFQVLLYLKEKNIIHRDIKLENVLFKYEDDDSQIKLVDFGLSCYLNDINYQQACGTPGCVAPEMFLGRPYDFKIDIFSAGVMLYTMLSGVLPFHSNDINQVIAENYECEIIFHNKHWHNISQEAIYLIRMMTQRNPKQRYGILDCLNSSWIKLYCKEKNDENEENLKTCITAIDTEFTTACSIPTLESKFMSYKEVPFLTKGFGTNPFSEMNTKVSLRPESIFKKYKSASADSHPYDKTHILTNDINIEEKIEECSPKNEHNGIYLALFEQGKYVMNPKLMPL